VISMRASKVVIATPMLPAEGQSFGPYQSSKLRPVMSS
jgi:hypothetical protein